MIIPRYYQSDAVDIAKKEWSNNSQPFVLVLPTGSGKSIVISELCHQVDEPILILQPTYEILMQNYKKLCDYGVMDIQIYSASASRKNIGKFTYATIGSIYKKPELFKHFKHIIMDECHLYSPSNGAGMYNQFFKAIGAQYIVGLTATPYRMVQKTFGNIDCYYSTATLMPINRIHPFFFRRFAYQISIQELLEGEYLSPLEYKSYEDFDISELKVNSTGADYDEESLQQFWNEPRILQLSTIIHDIDSRCKHNIIFCSTIEQAKKTSEMLRTYGLSSDWISSEHSKDSRDRILTMFRNGAIKHIANVGILTLGFDFPELDCITLARPTMSLGLYYQMVGRGFRPYIDKDKCLVVDLTSNVERFGKVETIKIEKEPHGFKDIVTTEVGEITNKPLTYFHRSKNGR